MLRPGHDKGLATPIPLGLAALATTSFLLGFATLFQPLAASPSYLMQSLLFGGLLELLAGMWAFAYGDALAATAFSFLGVFFTWCGLTHLIPLSTHVLSVAMAESIAIVFIVAGAVTLYLWIASFYESVAFNLTLLFLWIALALVGIAMLTDTARLLTASGLAAIISGLIAAYGSFAGIYNAASLSEVVPLGEFAVVRQRAEREEMERIRRNHHPTDHIDPATSLGA